MQGGWLGEVRETAEMKKRNSGTGEEEEERVNVLLLKVRGHRCRGYPCVTIETDTASKYLCLLCVCA